MRGLSGRRLAIGTTLLIAACAAPAPPEVVPAPSASPRETATVFDIRPDLFIEGRRYPVRDGERVNGDEILVFRLGASVAMDLGSVSAAVRAGLPGATGFRGADAGYSVLFEVAPGTTSFTVDPTGARSTSGGGTVVASRWRIERPETFVSLFDPGRIVDGDTAPARTLRFAIASNGGDARFDAAMRTVLLSHTPANASFIDLTTNARTPLPDRLATIHSNGSTVFGWLSDGQFLAVGGFETFISGPRGEQLRALPALPGQSGVVSPSGRLLALWSYAEGTAAIVDLDAGTMLSLGGGYLRCSVGGGVGVVWAPDSRAVALSHCGRDMAGRSRTLFIDAASGRLIRTMADASVVAWLADGRLIVARWSETSSDPRRVPEPQADLVDANGRKIGQLSLSGILSISPDGRWLLDTGDDRQHPRLRLVEIATGRTWLLPVAETFGNWTSAGLIAVVSSAPPR